MKNLMKDLKEGVGMVALLVTAPLWGPLMFVTMILYPLLPRRRK